MAKAKTNKVLIPKPQYKKANFLMSWGLFAVGLYAKLRFRIRFNKDEMRKVRKIKGPILVMSNHTSPIDFAIAPYAMKPRRMAYVPSEQVYYTQFGSLLRKFGNSIPIAQFGQDFRAMMDIKKMLNAGVSVLLVPEGLYSLSGVSMGVGDNIVKLIRLAGAPVVTVVANGLYSSRPRYLMGFRKGRVECKVTLALQKEEIANMTDAQIGQAIAHLTDYNEFDYIEKNNLTFKSKHGNVEGLTEVLYKCPKCLGEFCLKEDGDQLVCTSCGNTAVVDNSFHITPTAGSVCPSRIDYWYQWQSDITEGEVANDPNYSLVEPCEMRKINPQTGKPEVVESGEFSMTREGFRFVGETKNIFIPLPNVPAFSMAPLKYIHLNVERDLCEFEILGENKPIKYNTVARLFAKERKALAAEAANK